MGCMQGKSHIHLPPEEQTPESQQKVDALRKLWTPGSIWTGAIDVNGIDGPWEVHVNRDSTPDRITAKRVANFARLTFIEAKRVEFDLSWEERMDEKGKHRGYDEIITFEWMDDDYRLFADTLNGFLSVPQRRIRGLVVDNKTKNIGSFDFCRLMSNRTVVEQTSIESPKIFGDRDRTNRIIAALNKTNKKRDEDQRRLTESRVDNHCKYIQRAN